MLIYGHIAFAFSGVHVLMVLLQVGRVYIISLVLSNYIYGGGSSGDDEGAPPSPPLGMALADATADMWQRTRRTRPKPPSPVWRGAGGDDGVDVKGENR